MESTCRVCGSLFASSPTGRRAFYCSGRCRSAADRAREANRGLCTEPDCDRGVRAKGLCVTHYNKAHHSDSRDRWPRSPEATARSRQNRNHRRRAQLRADGCEVVDRDKVGDRDGWRCGICHRKVNRHLTYPHPRSPSLDHIVPLSEHGPHTYANTRIAHLKCNTDRSNRGASVQLALIG